MRNIPELIVMLTYADLTVKNAAEIFEQCKNTKAKYWGFKEIPLPLDEMKELFSYMRQCGKLTGLEVVEYTDIWKRELMELTCLVTVTQRIPQP